MVVTLVASIEGVHEETIGPIALCAAAVPEVSFQEVSIPYITLLKIWGKFESHHEKLNFLF